MTAHDDAVAASRNTASSRDREVVVVGGASRSAAVRALAQALVAQGSHTDVIENGSIGEYEGFSFDYSPSSSFRTGKHTKTAEQFGNTFYKRRRKADLAKQARKLNRKKKKRKKK